MVYFLSKSYIVQILAVLFSTDFIVSLPFNSKPVSDQIFDTLNSSQCKIPSKNRAVILGGSGIKHKPDMKGSIASHCSKQKMLDMNGRTEGNFVSLSCNAILSESKTACKILTTDVDEMMINVDDAKVGTLCETLTRPAIKFHHDKVLCRSLCGSKYHELCLSVYYIEQLVIHLNKINQGAGAIAVNADQSKADGVSDNQRNIMRLPLLLNGTSAPTSSDLSGVPGGVVTGDVDQQSSTIPANISQHASTNLRAISNVLPLGSVISSSAVVTSIPQQQQDSNQHTDAVPKIIRNSTVDSPGKTKGPPLVKTPSANSSETHSVHEENIQGPKTHLTDAASKERVVGDERPVDGDVGAHDEFDDGSISNPNLGVVEDLPKLDKQPTRSEEQPLQREEQQLQREEQPLQREEQLLPREEQPLQREKQLIQREEQPLPPPSDVNTMTNLQQPAVPVGPYEAAAQPQSNFFAYFLTVIILCIVCYLVFHNKKKILALLIEGRQSRGRRRGRSSEYRKLNTGEGSVSEQQRREVTNNIIY